MATTKSDTILFANNAQSTLAGAISSVATTANLAPGTGALFPSPGADEYFVLTFNDASTGLLNEIVHVTDVTGDVITMVRAQEGTTALAWSAGDIAASLVTAGVMENFPQLILGTFDTAFTGPFSGATAATIAYSIQKDVVTIFMPRVQNNAAGSGTTIAAALASFFPPALIPAQATAGFGVDATQAFWATVGALNSGSSLVPGEVLACGIDSTGAMQIHKPTNWATTFTNGWSAFTFSYQIAP